MRPAAPPARTARGRPRAERERERRGAVPLPGAFEAAPDPARSRLAARRRARARGDRRGGDCGGRHRAHKRQLQQSPGREHAARLDGRKRDDEHTDDEHPVEKRGTENRRPLHTDGGQSLERRHGGRRDPLRRRQTRVLHLREHLPPSKGFFYAVWLYNSPTEQPGPGQGAGGRLERTPGRRPAASLERLAIPRDAADEGDDHARRHTRARSS